MGEDRSAGNSRAGKSADAARAERRARAEGHLALYESGATTASPAPTPQGPPADPAALGGPTGPGAVGRRILLWFLGAVMVAVALAAVAAPNGAAPSETTTTLPAVQAEEKLVCQFVIANTGDIPEECSPYF